jgi:polyisoprenoid-binding protein YceI
MNLSTSQKIGAAVVILIVLGVAAYSYAFRPVAAPTVVENGGNNTTPTPSEDAGLHAGAGHAHTFVVDSAASKATFEIGEVLRGEPFMVVGTTSNVSGTVSFNRKDLSTASLSEIRVNARTLKTDSNGRNTAIARFILQSETAENEYIVFKATELKGLPASVEYGQELSFDIVGDLTVKGTTKQVTFATKATLNDHDTLVGSATTTINYKDFNLTIPSVPMVASVEDEVKITLDFTARVTE